MNRKCSLLWRELEKFTSLRSCRYFMKIFSILGHSGHKIVTALSVWTRLRISFSYCLWKFLCHPGNLLLVPIYYFRLWGRLVNFDARPGRARKVNQRLSKKSSTDSPRCPFCMLCHEDVKQSKSCTFVAFFAKTQEIVSFSAETPHASQNERHTKTLSE